MALTKSQILAEVNSLLASGTNIEAVEHRQTMESIIDKAYDENIDGVILAAVPSGGYELIFSRNGGAGTPIEIPLDFISAVVTDATLTGDGTTGTPLSAVQQDISGIATNAADISNNTTAIGLKADKATLTQSGGNVTGSIDTSANTFTLTASGGGGGGVTSVNGETGIVVLDGTEIELVESGGVSVTQAITDLGNADLQDITDNGNFTTQPIVAASINGAAITSSGSGGTLYLDDKGEYTAPPSGGGGEINTASNVGSGEGVFKQKNNVDLQFKSLESSGNALSVSSDANSVTYTLNDASFATAAQGTKADTALQPAAIGTTVQAHSAVLDATTASYTTATEAQIISNGVSIGELDNDKAEKHVLIRAITGITDTLVLSDDGKYLRYTNAAAVTATVPPNASVAFPNGTVITMRQAGAGQVTLSAGAGVTLNGNLKTAEQHASIQIMKVDTDVWDVTGGVA